MLILRRSSLLFLLALPVVAQVPELKEPDLPMPLLAEVTPAKTAAPQMKEGAPAAPPPTPAPTPSPAPPPASTGADLPPPISLLPEPGAIQSRPQATATESVVVNLINKLVERGALTKADAADLVKSAEQEAQMAQAQAQTLAETQAAVAAQSALPPLAPDQEEVRVTYIPEAVKEEIRSQLRSEIMADSRSQKWAGVADIPDWTRRTGLFGDIRMRYDNFMFPSGNDSLTGAFPNFNAINTGAPFDLTNTAGTLPPQINVNQDRDRYRLRMRLGFDIDLEDGFTAGIRMATGANNSPVSTNQTLGSANANSTGGNFSKYELWVDRAFIQYEASYHEHGKLLVWLGRFDNPFMTSSQIMWDEDVGLDGIAFKVNQGWTPGFSTFLTAGAFPVFNSAFNFGDNNTSKTESYNKYLLAAQFGVSFKITDDIEVKSSLAYYDWQKMEGRFSSPFVPASANDAGSTDESRPLFAQKGNTYRPIRNITATPGAAPGGNLGGTINQFQYFGLATKFRQLAWTGRVDFNHYEPVQISLLGEFIKNIGLDKAAMNDLARRDAVVNNRAGGNGAWDGGDTAWYMGINIGKAITAFDKKGDWALGLGYRHVESDAVIDGFTDSVFGFGGTNMEGYTLNAAMALSKRTWVRMAYMSADQIAGPQLRTDVFLFDFTAKF
ncbi:MAG: putative porin [Verrucomicrobiaceae bacterium]|nr:putative porin [Verrucomicrobiaceae bacterium]